MTCFPLDWCTRKHSLVEKWERLCVLLSFIVVVYSVLQGKFQAHRAGEGIMTGLLSSSEEEGEEEVRFNSLSFIVSSSSHLSHNDFENHMWSFF